MMNSMHKGIQTKPTICGLDEAGRGALAGPPCCCSNSYATYFQLYQSLS